MNKNYDFSFLSKVEKPSRYTGGEYNSVTKDFNAVSASICLAFPEVYELGMSYVGFKILYHLVNCYPEYCAERAYMPWPDMSEKLIKNGMLLSSLENNKPLRDFDAVGFTLQYELSYTNILAMLRLGGVNIYAGERGNDEPIVIAGGPNAVNPMPLVKFFDAFVIGDGEEVIIKIMDILSKNRKAKREKKLALLSELSGVYVPSIHDESKEIHPNIVRDLDGAYFPDRQIVPFLQCIHDRAVVEVMRGCKNGCRFCQAGFVYRPVRYRSEETVKKITESLLLDTGYDDISFTSLSAGDYPHLESIVKFVMERFAKDKISVSLPSLRVNTATLRVFQSIQSVRRTGVTFAPEAGSERLRRIINKKITEEEILSAISLLRELGWNRVKLYFMVGLPFEKEEDIEEMIQLIKKIDVIGRKKPGGFNITVSLSVFIPKPCTPFQWAKMASEEYVNEMVQKVCRAVKRGNIEINWSEYNDSVLECILGRGGKEIGDVIANAFLSGCCYDGWAEHRNFEGWKKSFEKCGLSIADLIGEQNISEKSPAWFIKAGPSREFLENDLKNAGLEQTSPDCSSQKDCRVCGVCGNVS